MNIFLENSQPRAVGVLIAALLLLCLFLPLSEAAQAPASGAAPAGSVDKGNAAFTGNGCNSCHGDQAEGAIGPTLAGTARSFAEFAGQVRKPKGGMPAFNSASLADSQLADIYAFLKSLPSPAGLPPTSAPAPASSATSTSVSAPAPFAPTGPGNTMHGKAIFTSDGCYQCHGLVGQGATQTGAPRIGPPPIPVSVFANYIRHPSGNMPPYTAKVVSDSDVTDIYAFLQSIKAPPAAKDIPLLNQ